MKDKLCSCKYECGVHRLISSNELTDCHEEDVFYSPSSIIYCRFNTVVTVDKTQTGCGVRSLCVRLCEYIADKLLMQTTSSSRDLD